MDYNKWAAEYEQNASKVSVRAAHYRKLAKECSGDDRENHIETAERYENIARELRGTARALRKRGQEGNEN